MSRPDGETMAAVGIEVGRARALFPDNRHLLAALMEEVGELAQALLQSGNGIRARKEAMQVACVAIRIMEEGVAGFGGALPAPHAPGDGRSNHRTPKDYCIPTDEDCTRIEWCNEHGRCFKQHMRGVIRGQGAGPLAALSSKSLTERVECNGVACSSSDRRFPQP